MGPAPICAYCVRLRETVDLTCDAFPGGIPDGIINGLVDHRLPVEGDGGLQWEQDRQKPDLPVEMYDALFKSGLPLYPATETRRSS